jgi:putative membrane protein insertion efficiency factor
MAVIGVSRTTLPLQAELEAIEVYTQFGSPVMSFVASCRFQPTCSRFALQSLRREGFLKGNLLVAKRLLNCSPVGVIWEALSAQGKHPIPSTT